MEILNVITLATWKSDGKTQNEGLVKETGAGQTGAISLLQVWG
jgi:hypothetical protein